MQVAFFTIPLHGGPEADALNAFLRGRRVVTVERQLVQDGAASVWAVAVTWLEAREASGNEAPRKRRVDYREVLDDRQFARFAKLRELRKTLAEREGVPPYALFTNEQLAAMVTGEVSSRAGLAAIDGVGAARIDKYGAAFLELLRGPAPGANDSNDSGDSGGAGPRPASARETRDASS